MVRRLTVARRLVVSLLVLHGAVLGLATPGEAIGFRIGAHGAKALAMDNAFVAQADDPSAVAYNPAGIVQLDGTQVQGGISFIHTPGSSYEPFAGLATLEPGTLVPSSARSADIDPRTFSIPSVFITHRATDRFSIGFGVYTPFGLQLDWPDDWTGRQITTFNEIKTNYFNLVGAYNVLPSWSVSAGLSYVRSKVRLSRTTYVPGSLPAEALIQFEADGWAVAPDLGTQVRLGDRVRLGANYRGRALVDHKGDIKIDPRPGVFAGLPPEQPASAKFSLPATLQAGIAVEPTSRWTVELDWDSTFWQSFEELTLDVPNTPSLTTTTDRGWHNSHTYRLGSQFQLTDPLALRLGFAYMETPIPDETLDPILPDSDRTSVSAGFGYAITKALTFDFAYEYQYFHSRAKNNNVGAIAGLPEGLTANGNYKTDAHAVVLQLKYGF